MNTADILTAIEEEDTTNLKKLAEKLKMPEDRVEKILRNLSEHNLIDFNHQTGEAKLSQWLANIEREAEPTKPAVATIILPKNQEIKIEDITLGNYTDMDLEINVRMKAKTLEIALCKIA